MAGDYWIKFYTEVIDDPKMATMPDRFWRRFFELCLAAGKINKDGELPDLKQLSWLLRMQPEELQKDIDELISLDLLIQTNDGYLVKNFQKRQAKLTGNERVRMYRERRHHDQYSDESSNNEDETLSDDSVKLKVTEITDNRIDNRTEQKQNSAAPLNFSESRPAIETNYVQVWTQVTDQAGIPRGGSEKILAAIDILRPRFKSESELIGFLKPYYKHWLSKKTKDGRPFSKANGAWLYDWAVAGEPLPGDKKPRERPDPNCPICNGLGVLAYNTKDIHDPKFGNMKKCECVKVREEEYADV